MSVVSTGNLRRVAGSIVWIALIGCVQSAFAQSELAACDLVDEQLVTTLLEAPIRNQAPNRQIRPLREGVTESTCHFFSARSRLYIRLYEYADLADARYSVRSDQELAPPGAKLIPQQNLGDRAYWFSYRAEAFGYIVQKGKRVLFLRGAWEDATFDPEVDSRRSKERFDVYIKRIVSKL